MMRGIEMKRKKAHHSWPQSEAIRGRRDSWLAGVVQAMCRNGGEGLLQVGLVDEAGFGGRKF
jgi:hypothetical protein